MKLNSRQYLLLAKQHMPKLCRMTLPLFGHKADMTIGFEDIALRGTWSAPSARDLLEKAWAVHAEAQR